MKKLIIILFVLLLSGCTTNKMSSNQAYEKIINDDKCIIVDVRTPEEYSEKHIKGAINIPLSTIVDEKPAQLNDLNQAIYVYCRSGNRSHQAAKKLTALGYNNVTDIGALSNWPGDTE